MSSSNRSHRPQPDRPTLKQRAADLEAGLARVSRRPAVESAPPPPAAAAVRDDAVHALIAEHRAAFAEWDRLSAVWNEMVPSDPGYAEAMAASNGPGKREVAAFDALFSAQPTTATGIEALASYLVEVVERTRIDAHPDDGERALGIIAAALRGLEPARLALAADLSSDVSESVLAAIKGHRDVMAATAELAEDDEDFDRQGEMQIAAERAVAEAPARSLADLRAKLIYLFPIIAPDMCDRTHARHLEAILADVDRLCRERSRPADNHEDVELLRLGEKLDRAHAHWRVMDRRNREPTERWKRAISKAKSRGGPTADDLQAAWSLPGVEDAHRAEQEAFGALDPICNAIWQLPVSTPAGLAVKARAALVHIWPGGSFEDDASLGDDEDLTEQTARRLIEACCTLAGVDWRGDPIAPVLPDLVAAAAPVKREVAAAESDQRPAASLIGMLDLASASLDELQAVQSMAEHVGAVAYAYAWGPRCHQSRNRYGAPDYNDAGKLMHWLGDALTDVESAVDREVARRVPENSTDRETRLSMRAVLTIDNGDPDAIEAFARELLDHAAVERMRG